MALKNICKSSTFCWRLGSVPCKVVVAEKRTGPRSQEATTNAGITTARNVVQALQTGELVHRVT